MGLLVGLRFRAQLSCLCAKPSPLSPATQYGEFRTGFDRDALDTRLVWYGIRYMVETFVNHRWTCQACVGRWNAQVAAVEDGCSSANVAFIASFLLTCFRCWVQELDHADAFYASHMAPAATAFPYPRQLFRKLIDENDGYLPVKLEALPEGTCIHAHVPVYQISAEGASMPRGSPMRGAWGADYLVTSWFALVVHPGQCTLLLHRSSSCPCLPCAQASMPHCAHGWRPC